MGSKCTLLIIVEQKAKAPAKALAKASAKKAPAAPKAKAAPKKQTQSTLKVTKKAAPKKRVVDSEDEGSDIDVASDDDGLLDTPPKKQKKAPAAKKSAGKPLEEIENESFPMDDSDMDGNMDGPSDSKPAKKGGNNTEKYQKVCFQGHARTSSSTLTPCPAYSTRAHY